MSPSSYLSDQLPFLFWNAFHESSVNLHVTFPKYPFFTGNHAEAVIGPQTVDLPDGWHQVYMSDAM